MYTSRSVITVIKTKPFLTVCVKDEAVHLPLPYPGLGLGLPWMQTTAPNTATVQQLAPPVMLLMLCQDSKSMQQSSLTATLNEDGSKLTRNTLFSHGGAR